MAVIHRRKKAIFKVYDKDGVYIKTWNDVASDPNFSWSINGGMSEMVLKLARKIDNFGEEEDVALFNEVKIYIRDRDNDWKGTLLYDGWIASYAPVKSESEEYIEIRLFSYLSELQSFIFEDGGGNTTINFLSVDPSEILKALITNYRRDSTKLNYTNSSIDLTGTEVTYEFKFQTYKECLDKLIELSPAYWYWYINAEGIIHYHFASTDIALYDLFVGQHIKGINVLKKGEDIFNTVYFAGGDLGAGVYLYKKYSRSGSITKFGERKYKMTDERVTVEATADIMAGRFLDQSDHAEATVEIEVIDNNISNSNTPSDEVQGFDIESIRPGDMIGVHLPHYESNATRWDVAMWDIDSWDAALQKSLGLPMVVLQIDYKFHSAVIKLSSGFPLTANRIEDINRNLNKVKTENVPNEPTT